MTGTPAGPEPPIIEGRQGHYAGAVSRLVAFGIDVGASWAIFALGVAGASLAWLLVTGRSVSLSHHQTLGWILILGWEFIYFSYQWAVSGKTIGMALFGVRVVRRDGSPLNGRRAMLRTIAFPLGFLTLGLGYLGILFGRERRAIYDRIAGTAVVYAWDAKAARLRWLARQDVATAPVVQPPAA